MNQKYALVAVIAIVIVLASGIGYYFYSQNKTVGQTPSNTVVNVNTNANITPVNAGTVVKNEEPAADSGYVEIKDFTFSPNTITVKAGSTVTWENKDNAPHTIKSVFFVSSEMPENYKFKYFYIALWRYEWIWNRWFYYYTC